VPRVGSVEVPGTAPLCGFARPAIRSRVVTSGGMLLCSQRSSPEGWRAPTKTRGGTGIAGQGGGSNRGRGDASGLSAGITIVASILLGAGLGFGLGSLLDAAIPVALAGAAAGVVFGFYAVYVRFIKQ
jgi:hypothetical protein